MDKDEAQDVGQGQTRVQGLGEEHPASHRASEGVVKNKSWHANNLVWAEVLDQPVKQGHLVGKIRGGPGAPVEGWPTALQHFWFIAKNNYNPTRKRDQRAHFKDGDIINIDVTPILEGYHGDTSQTFFVGTPSPLAKKLVEVTRECLQRGIDAVQPGGKIGDIGAAIQEYAEGQGFSVVRDFVGHGISNVFHTGPQVPHYGTRGKGKKIRPGMVFTIEPMINEGTWQHIVLKDGWTAITKDGKLSAQFEHTIAVTETGVEILTLSD